MHLITQSTLTGQRKGRLTKAELDELALAIRRHRSEGREKIVIDVEFLDAMRTEIQAAWNREDWDAIIEDLADQRNLEESVW